MKTKDITKQDLERIYLTMSVDSACGYLGITKYMYYKTLKGAGITLQRREYRSPVRLNVVE